MPPASAPGGGLPKGIAPKHILDMRLQQRRKALEAVEVLRDEDAGVPGVAGHRIAFGGVPRRENGQPLRISEVLLLHDETAVLVNLIATVELHEEFLAILDRIVATVSFTE